MGFNEAKKKVLGALSDASYQIEARGDIATKNLLATGAISAADLIEIIKKCNGTHHDRAPHHSVSNVEVHVLKRDGWYIKFYFIEPDTIFISVHQ